MILLGSFLHRRELAEIIGRSLEDRPSPEDARNLKIIVNFNSYIVRHYSNTFADQFFHDILGEEAQSFPAKTKGVLKDLIVQNPPFTNPRIEEIITRYHKFPEDFYRETPFEGQVYVVGDPPKYVGSRRIKRVRRIAEKCARRIIDYMMEQIRQRADELATERASRLGIPKERLITPPDQMIQEYLHAERRVLKSIRDGLFVAAMPQFYIDDIVGFRALVDAGTGEKVDEILRNCSNLSLVDAKEFSGKFNARNMVFAYRVEKDKLIENPPNEATCKVLISRGVAESQEGILNLYREFVRTGEEHVRFEILLNDYQELLESEIGKSMHEEHIRAQREKAEYETRLAANVEALMIFLFAYALSGESDWKELPIKLRGTYLPDYYESVLRALYMSPTGSLGLTM